MTDLHRWVAWVFDQPVPELSLYWNEDELGPIEPSADMFAGISQLFESPAAVLRPYSDAQLSQGFWFLCGPEAEAMRGLVDETIPWDARVRCIRSFLPLFRDLFMARCTPHLSHLMRSGSPELFEVSALNSACYMWWDFDCWGASPKVDAEYLEVMRQTLALPHDACRESALTGSAIGIARTRRGPGTLSMNFLPGKRVSGTSCGATRRPPDAVASSNAAATAA